MWLPEMSRLDLRMPAYSAMTTKMRKIFWEKEFKIRFQADCNL